MNKMDKNISVNDFMLLSVIGKGSYAKVLLVKKKDCGLVMALKVLKKEIIEKRKQEEHIRAERDILIHANHPFVAKLHCAFQDAKKLYFALEYCGGGELFNLLSKKRYFTEDQTRFYAAQILLAIEHLHSKDIIYRDLKPENVLIDKDGYIKITDFGLSKQNVKEREAHSVCGTPEYLAPETIMKGGHGKEVDWWALGCIIYEMITGNPPFYSDDRDKLFDQIKFGAVKFTSRFSPPLRELLSGLFMKDPDQRLGHGVDGAKKIKTHSWFVGVNWDALLNKKIKAPFIPVLGNNNGLSNFDPEFTESSVESFNSNTLGSQGYGSYDGFTYEANEMNKFE